MVANGRIFKYNERPADEGDVAALSLDFLPVSYSRLFNAALGKSKIIALFITGLKEKIAQVRTMARRPITAVSDRPRRPPQASCT